MTPALNRYGLLGRTLSHSVSPLIHNQAFHLLKIPAFYENIEIEPESFDTTIAQIKTLNFSGFNVTIPYKSIIKSHLDEIEPVADKIGAVNTLVIKNGKWKGYNTDITGFKESLKKPGRKFENCLLIGSGGAARAVLYVLLEIYKPVKIQIISILPEEAENLINYFKDKYTSTELSFSNTRDYTEELAKYDLIINATPVGMYPHIDQSPLPALKKLKNGCVVYDLIYNPLKTRLLTEAEQAGNQVSLIGGIEMLLLQAAASFQLWTGRKMPLNKIRGIVIGEMTNKGKG
jgi:shikimate dehydrogenase